MTDALVGQVKRAMRRTHKQFDSEHGWQDGLEDFTLWYAPRIAACMRAVARCGIDLDAIDDGIHTPSEVERIAEEQENACLAAGLAALRGEP